MEQTNRVPPRFFGYPEAKEAPSVPYHKTEDANPVFGGNLLVIGAWLVSKLDFVQRYLWANAGFNGLRDLPYLKDYPERWEPTVVALSTPDYGVNSSGLGPKSTTNIPRNFVSKYHTIAEYHALYISGELTPLAVAESLLPLIKRDATPVSHHSTAFIDSHAETILEAARASTARYKAGKPISVFDGVPTAVKDECDVAGYRTTSGRKQDDNLFKISEKSTWPVQKWLEAGGIILGKLNMHELGADTTNNNPNWGTPRNPHNSQYYPGGSSGGPAYAVSSGLIPIALGSDGGGSIRIPSSFCGIYGLKPSHNRLEDTGSTVTVTGPMAATMSDLETAWKIMAVPNPSNPIGSLFAGPRSTPLPSNRPKIIGIYKPWFESAEPLVLAACNAAVNYYKKDLDYKVIDIYIPCVSEAQAAHAFTILSEMSIRARAVPENPSNWLSGLNAANKVLLAVGDQTPARDYLLAQQLRNMVMQHLAFLYQKHPGLIIVTPTTPMPGWSIGSDSDLKHGITDGNTSIRNMEYVWLANFAGNPAISLPVGYVDPVKGEGKIPIGLMGMGEWGSEDELIEFGKEGEAYLENVYEGGRPRPVNWEDVIENAKGKMGEVTQK